MYKYSRICNNADKYIYEYALIYVCVSQMKRDKKGKFSVL